MSRRSRWRGLADGRRSRSESTSGPAIRAWRSRASAVDVLPNAYGERTTASVVNIGADGSITVGNAAKANIIHDPKHTIYSAKRLIGRYFFSEEVKKARAICSYEIVEGENHSVRIQIREEVFSLPEIGAMVLRELKSIAESRLGRPVAKAVITVPAYFNDNQRQATQGRRRGSPASRCCASSTSRPRPRSPTASARISTRRSPSTTSAAAPSTSRCSRSARTSSRCSSTSGDTFLGGDDFDDRLIDWLADEFLAREGINLRNDPFALEKLKVAAENAKKALSIEDRVEIRIPDIITVPDGKLALDPAHAHQRRVLGAHARTSWCAPSRSATRRSSRRASSRATSTA